MGQVISYITGLFSGHKDDPLNYHLITPRFRSSGNGLNEIVDTATIGSRTRVVQQQRKGTGIPEVYVTIPSEGDLDNNDVVEDRSRVVQSHDVYIRIRDENGKALDEVVEVIKESIFSDKSEHGLNENGKALDEAIKERVSVISAKSAKKKPRLGKQKWIKHYCSSHKILLVGEGDFSFSACLAKAFGSAHNMVATSLDSIDFLKANYKNAVPNITKLKKLGCMVIHQFDATKMSKQPVLEGMQFERIVYNFPLVGLTKNVREKEIRRNQHLVEHFFRHAKKMITEEGEIHISHKYYGFFLEWNIKDLASKCGLELKEEVEFNLSDYPGYSNKFGFGGDDSFNCFKSKTYKFGPRQNKFY